jgi:hypothetical protein
MIAFVGAQKQYIHDSNKNKTVISIDACHMLNTNKNIYCIPSTPCIECKCDPCVCYLSICDYYSALENETLYFEHLFQYYNNRVIISSENKHVLKALICIYTQLQVHVVQRITELRGIINQLVILMTKRAITLTYP